MSTWTGPGRPVRAMWNASAMTRDYARAPRGQRVVGKVPRNRGTVLTMLGAIALDGVRALMTREGATSGDVFETYVRDHLIPSLNPGDVVVADDDGVVVVPKNLAVETAGKAQKRHDDEDGKRKRLAAGELSLDMYKMREPLAKAGLRYID